MSGDVLLQWQDESGAWQRGHLVLFDSVNRIGPVRVALARGRAIVAIEEAFLTIPHPDSGELLVMPLYAKRPVAVWVEIGKLSVVPDRTD